MTNDLPVAQSVQGLPDLNFYQKGVIILGGPIIRFGGVMAPSGPRQQWLARIVLRLL